MQTALQVSYTLLQDRRHVLDRTAEGKHPPPAELAYMLEHHGLPEVARKYVGKRTRDEINLGEGGHPPKHSVERLREYWHREKLRDRIERRRAQYARVRLDTPRPKDVHPRGRPREQKTSVLSGSRNLRGASGDWVRAEEGRWKIRAPLG